ncbi:hypothetical protein JCM10212_004826 [Sporobolomyces blumeae]
MSAGRALSRGANLGVNLPREAFLADSVRLSPLPAGPNSTPVVILEDLDQLVHRGEWEAALPLALDLDLDPDYVSNLAQHLVVALLPALDSSTLDDLAPKVRDRAWLAATCVRIVVNARKVQLAHKAVQVGLQATLEWIDERPTLRDAAGEGDLGRVDQLAQEDVDVRQIRRIRKTLLELGDRAKTWDAIWGKRPGDGGASDRARAEQTREKEDENERKRTDDDDEEEDHGWDDLDLPQEENGADVTSNKGDDTASTVSSVESASLASRPTLSAFLSDPLTATATSLAAFGSLDELKVVCSRHFTSLWPVRIDLVQTLPEWLDPEDYLWLLPAVDAKGREADWPDVTPWRAAFDWSEQLETTAFSPAPRESDFSGRRTSDELTRFYAEHIERVASLGFVHTALALVQHGASRGIMGLDELGEELSLLSKLVYDRPTAPSSSRRAALDEDLTLEYWRTLEPGQVVRAYLAKSDETNLATSIRRLVLPYLSVLESRLERAGRPDPTLSTRLLYDYVLSLTTSGRDLTYLHAIFESSKPTLPVGARIVKDDRDLARLAVAALYGSPSTDEPSIVAMGKIFECLPAFSDDPSHDASAARVDLFSLSTSLAPLTPSKLFEALSSASASSLSHALDLLDLHLSQLETFSRYSCPTPLSWFLESHNSVAAQRSWATRLARTAASGGGGFSGNDAEFESEDEWLGLGEVMRELTDQQGEDASRTGEPGQSGMGKAFWLLGEDEVWRIFFGGLLGAGRFHLARSLFNPSSAKAPLEPGAVEDLVISASREFYDNAEEGNVNQGDMKMAFDCLSAAPQTPRIRQERDFIEATSRLCSFRLFTRPGVPITPIEIRHAPDRLAFISRLLSVNEDAYRHPEMLLELVNKLGYRGDRLAEVRTLSMIGDAAAAAKDYDRAAEMCERMVDVVERMKKVAGKGKERRPDSVSTPASFGRAPSSSSTTLAPSEEAASHAWRSCFQLGKNVEFTDSARRMQVLGQALVLCPPEQIASILPIWTALEKQVAQEARKKKLDELEAKAKGGEKDAVAAAAAAAGAGAVKVASFLAAAASSAANSTTNRTPSPVPPPQLSDSNRDGHDRAAASTRANLSSSTGSQTGHLASEATAAASHTLRRAAALFPFGQTAQPSSAFSFSASTPSPPPTPPRRSGASPSEPPSSPPSRFASAFAGLAQDDRSPTRASHLASSGPSASGSAGGFRFGLSSRLTQGVDWLIGADEASRAHE